MVLNTLGSWIYCFLKYKDFWGGCFSRKLGAFLSRFIRKKSHTCMWRRWGTPQNFFLPFIDELSKTQKIRLLKKSYDAYLLRYECDRHNCHFRPLFALLPHWKKTWIYYPFTHVYHNQDHIMYGFWDMKCNSQNLFVILGYFLPFYPPKSPKNENFKKV